MKTVSQAVRLLSLHLRAGVVLLLSMAMFPFGMQAQAPATGTVAGRVFNQSTGNYVNNARVSIRDTNRTAYTDSNGRYRLTLVPEGERTLAVTTPGGLQAEEAVSVVAGSIIQQNLTVVTGEMTEGGVFELEELAVETESDAYAQALSQMRQSVNSTAVVDSGMFGDVTEGNIGEYVKFIPGISINYVAADVRSIEVRGLGAQFTPVLVDGNRMASAASSGGSRTFELEQVSLNNVERIEVTKVPTAAQPADALGGSVNLISKSAFERSGREVSYKVYLNANSEDLTFNRVPWGSSERHVVLPGVDFSYADVFNDGNMGIMLTYLNSNQFNEQHRARQRWDDFDEFDNGAVDPMPIMRRFQFQDGPKFTKRESYGLRADFRLGENSSISSGIQYNTYLSEFRNDNVQWDTNVTERADVADEGDDGIAAADRVRSNLGGGDIDIGGSWRNKSGNTVHTDIEFKHYATNYGFEAGVFYSRATNNYDDVSEGFIEEVSLDYDVPGYIGFSNFGGTQDNYRTVPDIEVTDEAGDPLPGLGVADYTGYELLEIGTREVNSEDEIAGANADVDYHMNVGEIPVTLSGGVYYQTQNRDNFAPRTRLRYVGPDDAYDPNDFINTDYLGEETGFNSIPPVALVDHTKLYQFYLENPDYFAEGDRYAENLNNRASGDFEVTEDITAGYLMARGDFLDNQLTVNVGVRYERTSVEGESQRVEDPDGEDGPELPVIAGQERVTSDYDDLYPSMNLKWEPINNFVVRFGYAETIGRPDFTDILPLRTILAPFDDPTDPDDGDASDGSVEVNNTGLEPWEAQTYDLTFEYYAGKFGQVSLSVFRKELDGVILEQISEVGPEEIEEFNLPESTLGYSFETMRNSGDGRVNGLELSYIQSLREFENLPGIVRGLSFFANGTWQEVKGDFGLGLQDELPDFVDRILNLGVTYEDRRFKAQVRYNLRGRNLNTIREQGDADAGTELFVLEYYEEFPTVDINVEFRLTRYAAIFLNGRNVFEEPQDRIYVARQPYDFTLLDRRERFGVQWTCGVKGTF